MKFPSLSKTHLAGLMVCLCASNMALADTARTMSWTTLGTQGGPNIRVDRSQPANRLTIGKHIWMVDCGEGALSRLAATNAQPVQVDRVFISHQHFDHIGDLSALIGLRWMQGVRKPLTVYGPKGTDTLVKGIVASLNGAIALDLRENHQKVTMKNAGVNVIILKNGSDITIDDVRIRTVANSHFDGDGKHQGSNPVSLSYRFDYKGYSIGYTGDTGVSKAVETLFSGVNLMVSEVIDLKNMIALVKDAHSPVPVPLRSSIIEHFKHQHLTAKQAGEMAQKAHAQELVFTHISTPLKTDAIASELKTQSESVFKGKVFVAHDLDQF